MTPAIRRATPADGDALAKIESDAAHHPWSHPSLLGSLLQPGTVAWVVTAPDVVAHLITQQAADVSDVLTLAVAPSHQRRGLARALLATAMTHWRSVDVTEAFLEVRTTNTPARALYQACGWREVGRRPAYYDDGADAVVMRREVP